MDEKQSKQLKEILKSEFLPLFVGLRNELKAINDSLEKQYLKELPEVQKTEIINHPDPLTKVDISNLPDVQKVEVLNQPEPIKEVGIIDIAKHFDSVQKTFTEGVGRLQDILKFNWNDAKANVFDVNVKNPIEFPQSIKVDNLADIVIPKIEIPKSIKVSNYLPADAIPVILTERDRKTFYNAFQQMYVGNDVNLERIIKAIQEVTVDIGEINVDLDDVEALIQTTNDILADILLALGGASDVLEFFGSLSVAGSTESTLATYTVPVSTTFRLRGFSCEGDDDGLFKIYVDAVKIWQGRIAWTSRTISGGLVIDVLTGSTIELKVENLKAVSRNFSGAIYGDKI